MGRERWENGRERRKPEAGNGKRQAGEQKRKEEDGSGN